MTGFSATTVSAEQHTFVHDVIEPKSFLPHETAPGMVPRRIEGDRKKRAYESVDIVAQLLALGVMNELKAREVRKLAKNNNIGDENSKIEDIPEEVPQQDDGLDDIPLDDEERHAGLARNKERKLWA